MKKSTRLLFRRVVHVQDFVKFKDACRIVRLYVVNRKDACHTRIPRVLLFAWMKFVNNIKFTSQPSSEKAIASLGDVKL